MNTTSTARKCTSCMQARLRREQAAKLAAEKVQTSKPIEVKTSAEITEIFAKK